MSKLMIDGGHKVEKISLFQERAVATSWFLIDHVDQLVPDLWLSFQKSCGDVIGFEVRPMSMETYRRVMIECLAWACYSLRKNQLPSHITKLTFTLQRVVDEPQVTQFFALFLEDMVNHVSPFTQDLRTIEITSYQPFKVEAGGALSLDGRVSEYLNAPTYKMASEQFIRNLALALGPEAMAHAKAFAAQILKHLDLQAEDILNQVMSFRNPVETIEKILDASQQKRVEKESLLGSLSYEPQWVFNYGVA